MKKQIKIQSLLTFIATFGLHMPMYSCIMTFTNDGPSECIIYDANESKAYKVGKNKAISFGDAHVKAKFALLDKQPRARSFDLCLTCEQVACAGDGKPHLRYSDLINGTNLDLFKVETVKRVK